MAIAGYSGTPLLRKLGIKPGMKLKLVHQPADYFILFETNIQKLLIKKNEIPDWIHLFAKSQGDFEMEMKKIKPIYKKNTSVIIWVSWYKKVSDIPTDLTEDVIRKYALKNGLVDIKICAVNELWSGLKLVVPLSKR